MRVQRTVKHRLSSIDASSGRPDWPELPGLLETGIEALDRVLPKGIPRNTMMILAGELGTGKSVLMGELFFNILKKRKEPCIYVNFEGPPIAVEQDMEAFGWDIMPFLESGQLRFLDCRSEEHTSELQSQSNLVCR